MPESTQHKLDRVRKPRVHITYDLEVNGAIESKEVPFVVGVLSDLSGNPSEPLPKLSERKFVAIDRDNFDDVLAGMKPRLQYRVPNRLADDGSQLSVEMNFSSLDDFRPESVVEKVGPLKDLMDLRRRLSDFGSRLDGNDKGEEFIQQILHDSELLNKLKEQTGEGGAPAQPKEGE
jgi:type VI secretion system protein ImpB